ncbi:MAG: (d)CMP kinase [Acutalibacteraceae bacterium]|nr:(d)CMP kinase [Clostridia bacterium]MEE3449224.1 (d)CMP kinase [Acutalibacteraceae bacterium]
MFNVAIDGPSGAGKSSVSKEAAKRLGFIHVDTGALYRSLAYAAMKNDVDINDEISLKKMLNMTKISIEFKDGTQNVFVNQENVNDKIRTEQVSKAASDISKIPMIRAFLLDLQRDLANENNVVMDGRDIGSVVLPNADVKIFITASPEQRAERRYKELLAKGEKVVYNDILEKLVYRDHQDTHREIAPLKPCENAVIIDTSELDFSQSVNAVLDTIREKYKQ